MHKLAHNEIPRPSADELARLPRHPVCMVLHNIRSAHNVGSVLRTADAMRISEVVVSGYTPDPSDRKVHKTALGAQDSVPWRRVHDIAEACTEWRRTGHTIAALELTDQSRDIRTMSPALFPVVFIAGNEVEGVSDDVLAECDMAFEIPQFGLKQSLNVSVAAAVAMYEAICQVSPS